MIHLILQLIWTQWQHPECMRIIVFAGKTHEGFKLAGKAKKLEDKDRQKGNCGSVLNFGILSEWELQLINFTSKGTYRWRFPLSLKKAACTCCIAFSWALSNITLAFVQGKQLRQNSQNIVRNKQNSSLTRGWVINCSKLPIPKL